jgi:phosphocarrier protein HPr
MGIHARVSAKIVRAAMKFRSRIDLSFNERTADARSILAVMLLAAHTNGTLRVTTDGPDECEAMEAIAALIGSHLNFYRQ